MDFPTLYTERLTLRMLDDMDKHAILEIYSNPEVTRHYDLSTLTAPIQAEKLIDYFNSRFKTRSGVRWGIVDKGTRQLVGTCGFNSWNPKYHSANIGFELHHDVWGKGFATEALHRVLDYAYDKGLGFEVNRIQALVAPKNEKAINLVEKLGFEHEGLLRDYGYWKGQYQNVLSFSLLRRDWGKPKKNYDEQEPQQIEHKDEKKSGLFGLFGKKKSSVDDLYDAAQHSNDKPPKG